MQGSSPYERVPSALQQGAAAPPAPAIGPAGQRQIQLSLISSIGQDADVVMFIHRKDVYTTLEE